VSTVDRGHLCYRSGRSGQRARSCPASAPKCSLCESLGAPVHHRMGRAACIPPRVKRKRPTREPAAERSWELWKIEVALAVVAEPYRVPDAPNWVGNLDGSAAITWTAALGAPGALFYRGGGYVAVEWTGMVVVGVYVSPNSCLAAFADFLDGVGE
jgi:hypothetical protein